MIVNIPSPHSLNHVALRLYFYAWSSLITIAHDFDEMYDIQNGNRERLEKWASEWSEYIGRSQPELELVCTVIQQSNELALKSKISEVSPYLLLLKNDSKFSTAEKDVDFTELRTLDAVDLPGVVNTFCPDKLSAKFIQTYNDIRALRNKIAHLGHSAKPFSIEQLLGVLAFQFAVLWPGRPWLNDFLEFEGSDRLSFFSESEMAAQAPAFYKWRDSKSVFSKKEFSKIFGCEKSQLKYICFVCFNHARGNYFDLQEDECRTAYLKHSSDELHCLMCNEDYKLLCHKCGKSGCPSTLSAAMAAGHFFCPSCGNEDIRL